MNSNLFSFVLDWDGGTYISQVKAHTLNDAKMQWISMLDLDIFATDSAQLLADLQELHEPIPVDNLQSVWRIQQPIQQLTGIIHIIKTCSTRDVLSEITKQKCNNFKMLFTLILDWQAHPHVTQITLTVSNPTRRTLINLPRVQRATIKGLKTLDHPKIFGSSCKIAKLLNELYDTAVPLDGLQSAWCNTLSFNDQFGIINIFHTCP